MGDRNEEKKYRKIGWLTSLSIQLALLILFYFLVAWKEPFPPIPSYGIELNFGLEDAGKGTQPVTSPKIVNETEEEEITETEQETGEFQDEALQEAEEMIEEVTEEIADSKETTPVNDPEQVKTATEPAKAETREENTNSNPVSGKLLYPKESETPVTSEGSGAVKGDEGKKEGELEGKALMGNKGAVSDGSNLQMAGWTWDFKPNPQDNSSESGRIVYTIVVDQDGYIEAVNLVSSTVSPAVERIYRQSVERLTFSKTNDYQPAPTSSGTITFIIRTN